MGYECLMNSKIVLWEFRGGMYFCEVVFFCSKNIEFGVRKCVFEFWFCYFLFVIGIFFNDWFFFFVIVNKKVELNYFVIYKVL